MALHPTDHTSLSLIDKIKLHDGPAWHRLVDLYGPLVVHWCRRQGLSDEDSADVVQNVFAAAARNIERFRRERPQDTFRGWLRVVTRSQIAMHFRQQSRQVAAAGGTVAHQHLEQIPESLEAADDEESAKEQSSLFLRSLELIQAEFEITTWQAFWRVVVEQQPADDVAKQLGLSAGALRQAKYRVLKRLRDEFAEIIE